MRPNGEPAWKIPDGAGYLVWELCDEEEKEEDDKEDDKDDDDDDDAIIQRSATLRLKKCVNQNLMFPSFDTCLAMFS